MTSQDTPRADAALRLRVTGRVQGVGFRHWTAETARRLSLSGFVRNLTDGAVEALFVGDPQAVARMEGLCADGPEPARVDAVTRLAPGATAHWVGVPFRQAPTGEPGAPDPAP